MQIEFEFENSKGLHAIENIGKQRFVYFVSPFNEVEVNLGDICEIEVVGNICKTKRNNRWYDVSWVKIVNILSTSTERKKRREQLQIIKSQYGREYPRSVNALEHQFLCGEIDIYDFDSKLRKRSWGF